MLQYPANSARLVAMLATPAKKPRRDFRLSNLPRAPRPAPRPADLPTVGHGANYCHDCSCGFEGSRCPVCGVTNGW